MELYVDSYRDESITQAAVDLSKLDAVAAAIDTLAKALTKAIKKSPDYTAVTKSLNATQRFDTPDFVDLGHFCQELSKRSTTKEVKAGAKATIEALTAAGRLRGRRTAQGQGREQRQRRRHLLPARAGQQGVSSARLRQDERLAHVPRGVSQGVASDTATRRIGVRVNAGRRSTDGDDVR